MGNSYFIKYKNRIIAKGFSLSSVDAAAKRMRKRGISVVVGASTQHYFYAFEFI